MYCHDRQYRKLFDVFVAVSVVQNVSMTDVGPSFFAKFVEFHAVMLQVNIVIVVFLSASLILSTVTSVQCFCIR